MAENPTLDKDPKAEGKEINTEEKVADIDAFMKTLESYGVKDPDDLTGKLNASQQYGQMANLLGQERERVKDLENRLASVEQSSRQPRNFDESFDYGEQGSSINLKDMLREVYREERNAEKQEMAKMQEAQMAAYNKIRSSKHYNKVKDVWEGKLKDPNFLYELQAGITDPYEAFRDVVDDFHAGLISQSYETIQQLQGKKTETKPPHVESGDQPTDSNLVSEEDKDETLTEKTVNKAHKLLDERRKADPSINRSLKTDEELILMDAIMKTPPGEFRRPEAERSDDSGRTRV